MKDNRRQILEFTVDWAGVFMYLPLWYGDNLPEREIDNCSLSSAINKWQGSVVEIGEVEVEPELGDFPQVCTRQIDERKVFKSKVRNRETPKKEWWIDWIIGTMCLSHSKAPLFRHRDKRTIELWWEDHVLFCMRPTQTKYPKVWPTTFTTLNSLAEAGYERRVKHAIRKS